MRSVNDSCELSLFAYGSGRRKLITTAIVFLLLLSLFPLLAGDARVAAEGEAGAGFEPVTSVSNDLGRTDNSPVVAVCPVTGTSHIVWMKSLETGTSIYYADNQEMAFSSPIELSTETSVRDFNPRIDVDRFGRSHVAWESEVSTGRHKIRYVMVDNGKVCRRDTVDASSAENDHEPDISADGNGDAHIAFRRNMGGYFNVHYSCGSAGTFSVPVNIGNRTSPWDMPPLIRTRTEPDGRVYCYVVWQVNNDWQLGYNSNDRPDGLFLPEAELVYRGYSAAYGFGSLDFDVDDDGVSHISVWGRTPMYNETFYYIDNSGGTWNWRSYGSGYPDAKKMAVDSNGRKHFCWNAGRTLYYGRNNGPGTAIDPQYTATIAPVEDRWAIASMDIDRDGFAHIIWTGSSGGSLLYTTNSSGGFLPPQALSAQYVGSYSIKTDAWNSSHVCFTHQVNTSADMEVLYLSDADYSTRPRITGASPPSAARGETLDVEVTGVNTGFHSGTSDAVLSGEGITVNSTTVVNATRAIVNITVGSNAAPGPRNVNVVTGDEIPARLGEGLTVFPAMLDVSSTATSMTETLASRSVVAENLAVTGDLGGTMNLGFETVRIATGSFKDRGFFEGQWNGTLETAAYEGEWKGTLKRNPGQGTITLKGTFSGQLEGTAEAVLSESTPGSGIYDVYTGTWKINIAGSSSTYAVLQQEGAAAWSGETTIEATGIRALQGSFNGEGVAGDEILPMSAVLTHIEVSEEASPYKGEGFSFISYNTPAGAGEVYSFDVAGPDGKAVLTGVSTSPFAGKAGGVIYTDRNPRMLVLSIDRFDSSLEPAPDLTVKMVMPGQVSPGQEVTYLIECRNDGLVTAEDVQVVQVIADTSKVSFLRSTGAAYYDEFGVITLVWNVGDLPPKQSTGVSSRFKVKEGQPQGVEINTMAYVPRTNIQLPPKVERMETAVITDTDDNFICELHLENEAGEEEVRIEIEVLDAEESQRSPQVAQARMLETDNGYTIEFEKQIEIIEEYAREMGWDRDIAVKYVLTSTFVEYEPGSDMLSPLEELSPNRISFEKVREELIRLRDLDPEMAALYQQYIESISDARQFARILDCIGALGTLSSGWYAVVEYPYSLMTSPSMIVDAYTSMMKKHYDEFWDIVLAMDQGTQSVVVARDPNVKYGPEGVIEAGQKLDYRVECENEGEGTAFGVYFTDVLDEDLAQTTLDIGPVLSVATGNEIAPPGTYDPGTRTITWMVGQVGPGEGGYSDFSVNVRGDAPKGTEVINYATVYFPSVPEVTPTNAIVSYIPYVPRIDATGPASGEAGTLVAIDGEHFGTAAPGSYVSFGDTRCSGEECPYWTDSGIMVAVPEGVSGSVNVTVTTEGGTSNPMVFTGESLAVVSIAPASGVENTIVDITNLAGTGFKTGATVRIERQGKTVDATNVNVVSGSRITCRLNLAGAPLGKYDVIVRNPGSQEARLAQGFSVTNTCGGGAAVSLSLFGLIMGLLSAVGTAGIGRRRSSSG